MADHFETSDIVRHSKLSAHMVTYLIRSKVLCPTLSKIRRRGVRRRFSFTDLLLARAIAKLLNAKVEVSSIRSALRTLRQKLDETPPSVLATRRVVIVGQAVYLTHKDAAVVELTAHGQLAFHFMLDTTGVRQSQTVAVRRGQRLSRAQS